MPGFDLPAHSPLGASSAERWMNCPGSVSLIKSFVASASYIEGSPDWQQDGVEAHSVAAYCLQNDVDAWRLIGHPQFPRMTPDMGMSVQVYLDYVRTVCGGESYVEYRLHRPNLHQLAYGTLDFACVQPGLVRIVDYKHGAGVYVEVRRNPQIMYYANLLLDELALPDDTAFELTIVQPNAYTPEGEDVIRTWETNAKALRDWLTTELVPSMDKTQTATAEFKQGEWCRFCPVKIVCPAMALMVEEAIRLNALPYEHVPLMKMLIKASETDEYNRLMDGQPSTGGKLVMKKTNRVWKSDAKAAVLAAFGDAALSEPELLSPAQVEKLPGGKVLVAEYAMLPEAGMVVAPIDDSRKEMRPVRASELHGAAVQKILDAARKTV
jgi:hypothetical protein